MRLLLTNAYALPFPAMAEKANVGRVENSIFRKRKESID